MYKTRIVFIRPKYGDGYYATYRTDELGLLHNLFYIQIIKDFRTLEVINYSIYENRSIKFQLSESVDGWEYINDGLYLCPKRWVISSHHQPGRFATKLNTTDKLHANKELIECIVRHHAERIGYKYVSSLCI